MIPIIVTHWNQHHDKLRACEAHLKDRHCPSWSYFFGYPGRGLKTRQVPNLKYLMDPGEIRGAYIGQNLTHWHLWSSLKNSAERHPSEKCWDIVEDDVWLNDGWSDVYGDVVEDIGAIDPDWNFINWGACCVGSTETTQMTQMSESIYRGFGQCLHFYTIRRQALDILLETNKLMRGRIDQQMLVDTYPHLNAYCVLPRIASQRDTDLPL